MATTETENGFDVETFRNVVALFDSNNAGEAGNSFRKAVLVCAKNGLSFVDAVAEAYGQQGESASELEAENAELRAEVERLKQGGDQLADALESAQEKLAALQGSGESGGRMWPADRK